MDNAITTRSLVKTYRRPRQAPLNAVDGIDLDIRFGECYCLLGPNGAGKSTTVEILEGARRATSGEVSVLGYTPYDAPAAFRARIGVVLQEASDGSHFTVEQTVRQLARLYPRPTDVDGVISGVGLGEKSGEKVKNLSGGQRRRLDVALGLVGRPEILFLDEPTTGFDPRSRRQFWNLMRTLHGDGATIVLTTHYLDEAEALADRIGIIDRGIMIAEGSPRTLGGADARVPRVRWIDAAGSAREERTTTPTTLIAELTPADGSEISELEVQRPSLEDVYLDLIGRPDTADGDDAEAHDSPITAIEGSVR